MMSNCQTAQSLQSPFKPNFLTFLQQRPRAASLLPGSLPGLHFPAFRCGCVIGFSSFDVLCATFRPGAMLEWFCLFRFLLQAFLFHLSGMGIHSQGDPERKGLKCLVASTWVPE